MAPPITFCFSTLTSLFLVLVLCLDFLCQTKPCSSSDSPNSATPGPLFSPCPFWCCSYPAGACLFLVLFLFLLLIIFVTHPQFRVWEASWGGVLVRRSSWPGVWKLWFSSFLVLSSSFFFCLSSTHTNLKEACCLFCSRVMSRLHTASACDWMPQNIENEE